MAEVRMSLLVHRICIKNNNKKTTKKPRELREYIDKQASSEIYIRVRMTITKVMVMELLLKQRFYYDQNAETSSK